MLLLSTVEPRFNLGSKRLGELLAIMPSLVALAEEQLALAKRLEATLEQNNIPPTSFERDTLELLPDDAQKLRWDLLDTSHELRQLLRGAKLSGYDICFSVFPLPQP